MYLQAFILVLLIGKVLRKIFFGQLRPAEFEVCQYFYISFAVVTMLKSINSILLLLFLAFN